MTKTEPEEDRLFDEAVDLLIRIQTDPDNPIPLDMAKRWLARGPAHECVWVEALEIHGMANKVLVDRRRAARKAAYTVSRRTLVVGGLLTAAGLAAGTIAGSRFVLQARADEFTGTGEVRRIELADGSIVTLGPDSAFKHVFTAAYRHIELLQGMAFFEVAPDAARPFRVMAAGLRATALGTAFDVSHDADCLSVSVEHGMVAIDLPSSLDPTSTPELSEGEWLTYRAGTGAISTGTRDRKQVASWREGLIVVERETVAAVVARISRWTQGEVLITSSALGSSLVSGVYDLGEPALALEAVVQPHGGKVRQVTPYLTVLSSF